MDVSWTDRKIRDFIGFAWNGSFAGIPAGPDNARLSEHYNPAREIIGYTISTRGIVVNFVSYLLERRQDPEKLFVSGDRGTLAYADLEQHLENLSSVLYRRFGSGKKILLMADNSPFFIFSYLSIINSGNIAILVETKISQTDLDPDMYHQFPLRCTCPA